MGPFLCEDFRSESFPYCNWKLIKRRDSGDKGDTGRSGDSEIELFSHTMIRNFSYAIRKAGRTFCMRFYLQLVSRSGLPIKPSVSHRKPASKWYGHFASSGRLTLYHKTRGFFCMQTQTPCSDHIKTKGLIYFARMLDKIRLKARGE